MRPHKPVITDDLGSRWRWVVSFTLRSLYLQGNSPWYPLGGP